MDIYIKKRCPYCIRLLELLRETEYDFTTYDVLEDDHAHTSMADLSGDEWVPQVHIKNVIMYDYDTEESLIQDIETISDSTEETLDASWIESHISSTLIILDETQTPWS